MKNHILFLLFLTIPVCVLVWFGFKAQSNEQLALQQQYQNLAQAQLKLVDAKIVNYFKQLETVLLGKSSQLIIESASVDENYTNKIRQFVNYSPYIVNVYITDNSQQSIYPTYSQKLSDKEQEFLSDIQVISTDRSLFKTQREGEAVNTRKNLSRTALQRVQAVSQKLSPSSRTRTTLTDSTTQEHGWIVWYQERNLHHLFWFKDAQERIYLLYLDRIRILSELVVLLPESKVSPAHYTSSSYHNLPQDTTIRLTDSNNELIYEWGDYPVNKSKSISIMLSYPLSSWQLSWYAKTLSEGSFQKKWSLLIIAVLASLLLLILMIIIYREYNRKIKLAQQRVSFVSQVSHELKTPLTNILMYAELLEGKIAPDFSQDQSQDQSQEQKKSQHFLNVIINESQRLSRLIENVLSFAKVQKNSLTINPAEGIIDQCIDSVLVSFGPILAQKKISVQFKRNAGQTAYFDSQLLEQILNNLLSNIEKYAAQGKQIDITSQQSGNTITIQLRDYGPGIAKSEQKKIFRPFYRSHSKLTEGVSGTGIGLTISQQLATLHGGSLRYKNVSQGACFIIHLETIKSVNTL